MHFQALCISSSFRELTAKTGPVISNNFGMSRQMLRAMKLSALLILIACLQVSAKGYSQITLSEKNAPLEKIFKAIESQSGYVFFYDYAWLKEAKTVNLKVKKASLKEALDACFKDQPLTYIIVSKTIVVKQKEEINNEKPVEEEPVLKLLLDVSGTVTEAASGKPLPGASVKLKGTDIGTSTDANGNFTLQIPDAGGVLAISYVGYESEEVAVSKAGSFTVSLKLKVSQVDEVIVIGFGERKKKDVTGAISNVTSKDIEKITALSPELALQGKAAGVFVSSGGGDPQARATVRIRGVNTFGNAEPLYVIDGVPLYEGGSAVEDGAIGDIRSPVNIFSMINAQDIESISVLKDASSAAIYGVRASNGVILITTKKGKSGRPKVEVASSFGVQNIKKTYSVLNTQQYYALVKEAYNANPDANTTFEQKFGPRYDASNSLYGGNNPTSDWQKELLKKNAALQDISVRVSGGNDATTYYLGAGYAKQESPLKANDLKRYSVVTNFESRIAKVISTGITIRLVQENALVNTAADLSTMASSIPFQPIFDPAEPTGFAAVASGSFVPNPDFDPSKLDAGPAFNFAPGDPKLLWGDQSRFNPFAFHSLTDNRYDLMRALGNAYLQIEPIPGLKLRGTLGADWYNNERRSWADNEQWRFSQTAGNPFANQNGQAKGTYGQRGTTTTNINKELTLNYNHTFFYDHNIDVLLGASDQFGKWVVRDLSGRVNFTDPQYRGIGNQPPFTQGFAGILQEDVLLGYWGRISYKFRDKYYVDVSYRQDESSKLAPGFKKDNFPSFALAWRVSAEKFFPKTTFINDLKLRGGWGRLGNVNSAGYYKFLSGVNSSADYPLGSGNGNGTGTQVQATRLPDFANTTLTWEKLRTLSAGFDAQLFNNHVSFTAEYYDKTTFDIIQSVSLPPNTGIQSNADLNVAQVKNSGIELQLAYNNKLGPVDFNISGNFTTVRNRVIKLNRGTPIGGEGGRIEEGYSMFYLWGYDVGGIFQTQAEIDAWRAVYADGNIGQSRNDPAAGYTYKPGDMYFRDVYGNPTNSKDRYSLTPDSIINSNDRTYLGKTIPGFYYGFNLGAGYKGFDINIFFQGVGDVQKYNGVRSGLEGMGSPANQLSTTLDRWTTSNPSTTIPRAVYNDPASTGRFSSRYVENAGYFRLRNLQIGYTLPKPLLSKTRIVQNIRLYVSGVNLFTITDWTGLDPETNGVPLTRQFLFGFNASF
ncbi:MAG: TonB-dependent receptor [Chitinophagaceae bacterium]